jgi:hypothetical protein
MPAPLAPFIGFALGVGFAWCAREELSRSPAMNIASRSFLVVTLFAMLVFAPVSAYFLAFESDWSYAYFIDTRRLPSAIQLALLVLDTVAAPVGFVVATSPARARKVGTLLTLAALPLGLVLACLAAVAGRLGIQASYTQFHGDFGTRPVAGSSLGYALLWMNLVLTLGVAWTYRQIQRLARAARASAGVRC